MRGIKHKKMPSDGPTQTNQKRRKELSPTSSSTSQLLVHFLESLDRGSFSLCLFCMKLKSNGPGNCFLNLTSFNSNVLVWSAGYAFIYLLYSVCFLYESVKIENAFTYYLSYHMAMQLLQN
jgi:hypothetical protein